jgi:hypothetical protein
MVRKPAHGKTTGLLNLKYPEDTGFDPFGYISLGQA